MRGHAIKRQDVKVQPGYLIRVEQIGTVCQCREPPFKVIVASAFVATCGACEAVVILVGRMYEPRLGVVPQVHREPVDRRNDKNLTDEGVFSQ